MRKTLVIYLLLIFSFAQAETFYIDPAGSDNTGSGTINSPWKTLAHACSRVTKSGDIIHVNAGTYLETFQSNLAVGVNIVGEGREFSIIRSQIVKNHTPTIYLYSGKQGTIGNQTISGIKMDGINTTAYAAIWIFGRSNVIIHDCEFVDFKFSGVTYNGKTANNNDKPLTYATGNKFYNNIIINCAYYYYGTDLGLGALQIGAQEGMLIYNNYIEQTGRPVGHNGHCIKFYSSGFLKGLKIYKNTLRPTSTPLNLPSNTAFVFAIELWNVNGGLEIYENDINNAIDLVNTYKGDYDFGAKIYNNLIGWEKLMPMSSTHDGEKGIQIEYNAEDIFIYNNHLRNLNRPLYFTAPKSKIQKNIHVYYNLVENIGADTEINSKGWGINIAGTDLSNTYANWNIYNNVFKAKTTGGTTMWGVCIPSGITSNIKIKNNIIIGFRYASVFLKNSPASADNIFIENNIFYLNGNNNAPRGTATLSNYIFKNNIISDPLFVSPNDFHLQSSSPGISAGVNVGLDKDYAENSIVNPPSIGVYEYLLPAVPVYQNSAVENSTPSLLEINYSLILDNSALPAAGDFVVQVNSVNRAVSSVSVIENKVMLTISGPVVYGDIVKVSYTRPAVNPLQSTSGGLAEDITDQPVTNNCSSGIPLYQASVVENTTPSVIEMTYDLTLANIIPDVSAFIVRVNSETRTVNTVSIVSGKVRLTLASPVVYGDVVTVTYLKPVVNPLQTAEGGEAETISPQVVTNNCSPGGVAFVGAVIENATPAMLEITFDFEMDNIVPVFSSFNVLVNAMTVSVNSVTILNGKVRLSLDRSVIFGDIISVGYTKPSADPLQTPSGTIVESFSGRVVKNNVNPVRPVYLSSVIENDSPGIIEITFDLDLANIIPSSTAFNVLVNGVNRTVTSVSIAGNKVRLSLSSDVIFGDVVTFSYTKPSGNPLQTNNSAEAESISSQLVVNNCKDPGKPNSPPEIVIKYESQIYSGFIGSIDASDSYDPDDDNLTFEWTIPAGVPVSSTQNSNIQFLSPVVNTPQPFEFRLSINDGHATQTQTFQINVLPYKPELALLKFSSHEGSNYYLNDLPFYALDGNPATKWSVEGDNQWLLMNLEKPSTLSHIQLSFLPEQKYESYFDIYVSRDNRIWEPVFAKEASCNFSGAAQVFDFPAAKKSIEYSFIQLIGRGNALNTWNYFSDLRIFGNAGERETNPHGYTDNISIYPNPAHEFINVLILEPPSESQLIRFIDLTGKICQENELYPSLNNIYIPLNLKEGMYIVQVILGSFITYAQKLVVIQ